MADVRRDRKFVLSLELHREIARLTRTEPERVRSLGLEGAVQVRANARSVGARARVDAWTAMLQDREWNHLREVLVGEDEESAEMRNMTVFLKVISSERRQEIVDDVYSRPGLLA